MPGIAFGQAKPRSIKNGEFFHLMLLQQKAKDAVVFVALQYCWTRSYSWNVQHAKHSQRIVSLKLTELKLRLVVLYLDLCS